MYKKISHIIPRSMLLRGIFFISLLILLLVGSFFMGTGLGNYIIRKGLSISMQSISYMNYFTIYNYVNSRKEQERLIGYYMLWEKNYIETDFFLKRYKNESQTYIKRTIIWILGYSTEKETVARFLVRNYYDENTYLKKEILKSLYHVDKKTFRTFIQLHSIPEPIISEITD